MTGLWNDTKEKLKELAGSWPGYITLGSFALYVLGYLCIRFHLTTLGIGTDLAVLDERYLFTGAKFLIYLLSTILTIILALLPIVIICLLGAKIVARIRKHKGRDYSSAQEAVAQPPSRFPVIVLWAGIIISIASIQLVMKQCFVFSDLLLANDLPWTWLNLKSLFLEEREYRRLLFFAGLTAVTALTIILYLYVRNRLPQVDFYRFLGALFALLVTLEFLFLPVNYGVFIMEKQIPRVTMIGGEPSPLVKDQLAWLVWEGKDGMTYLVSGPESTGDTEKSKLRRLVTVPKSQVKKVEIVGYDQIFVRIFGN